RTNPRIEHRRLDAVAIGYRIDGPAPAARAPIVVDRLHQRRRVVTRRDDQRDAERKLIAVLPHRLLVFELHQHGFARADIGDRVGEDVGTFLLAKARLLTGGLGALEILAGLLPALELAHDDPLADDHLEAVDGGAFRQRIDIDGFNPTIGRILKNLSDPRAGRGTADRQGDIG